jgi:hypothetical protein
MRWRVELETRSSFIYCSTSRSYTSAWKSVQRQLSRRPDARLRILSCDEAVGLGVDEAWRVIARVSGGALVEWQGKPVARTAPLPH